MIGTTMRTMPAKTPSSARIVISTAAQRGSLRRSSQATIGLARPSDRNSAVPT